MHAVHKKRPGSEARKGISNFRDRDEIDLPDIREVVVRALMTGKK
jgi:hypothetical protein